MENTIFDLQRQFKVRTDKIRRMFYFDAQTNKTNSYSVSFKDSDGKEVNAWIAVWNALKKKSTKLKQ